MDEDAERLLQGEAWRDWCDRLKAVGDRILTEDFPADPRSRTEGYRALLRRLRQATRLEIEAGDPLFPDFVLGQEPHSQWGAPNPDHTTVRAVIDPQQTYKVWADVDGMLQARFRQHDGDAPLGRSGVYHARDLDSFEVDDEGFLELILSPHEHEGNWIPIHPDARFFTIQIVLSDWENHTSPTFHIERADAEGEPPPPASASDLARGLDRAMEWVERSSEHWNRHARARFESASPNLATPAVPEPGGSEAFVSGHCAWTLAEDEALLLVCEVPIALYWGFGIQTLTWFESGDFARRQTSLSGDQIHLDEDGLARIVVSACDPGVPNWIDSEGRPSGLLAYHWAWAETNPTPEARTIPLDDLFDWLPDDHPQVAEDERRSHLSLRREAFRNRAG